MIKQGTVKQGETNQEWFVVDNKTQETYPLLQSDIDEWFNRATCCYKLENGLVIEYQVVEVSGINYGHLI
jgi:hypothetical protein